ncbi:MAG: carboxypeptidase regulatory-like domain-containing protein [Gemmatimonadaceae bacterium]
MLAGLLLSGEAPLSGGTVIARWTEVGIIRGKIGPAPHEATATTGPDGTYHLCDLPSDAAVNVDVRGAARRRIEGEVFIPTASVVRRDFHLADSSALRGSGVLTGRVSNEDGTAVGTARVSIPALGLSAAVRDGAFTLAQVPAGTWALEVRAFGYEPLNALVEVAEQVSVPAKITMAKEAQKLEAVNVVGKASREVKVLNEIHQRSLVAAGTQFLPGNSWLKAAFDPSDVLRAARGFNLKSATVVVARDYIDANGAQRECRTGIGAGSKTIAVYIDGLRASGGIEQLNDELRMDQVLAIETYPDVISAPFLWRNNTTCAVIAAWTKR